MKFYKRDPDAAISGMTELTLQERGAYNTIIDMLYSRDGEVRDDDETLRRAMGCHGNEWRRVKAKLIDHGKIWIEDGFVKAKRVDSVLQEAAEVSETQRNNAANRWKNADKLSVNRSETARKQPAKTSKKKKKTNKNNTPSMPYTPTATPTAKLSNTTPTKSKRKVTPFELPTWVPVESWEGFVEMRKKIRAPLTRKAMELVVKELKTLAAEGNNPGDVLDQSTERCWRGVFEIKDERRRHNTDPTEGEAPDETGRTPSQWRRIVNGYKTFGAWPNINAGPSPAEPGCRCPSFILEEFGLSKMMNGGTHADDDQRSNRGRKAGGANEPEIRPGPKDARRQAPG